MFVLDSNRNSFLQNVIIEDCSDAFSTEMFFTGAVTFYQSHVIFRDLTIQNITYEDALNFVNSKFRIESCIFKNTSSDAFDGDFCEGVIVNSNFVNIGGDAVDINGSKLNISDSNMFEVGDKGLSIGEKSYASASVIKIEKARFAVASKDLSEVHLQDINIISTIYGLAAYQKKPEYGPAKILGYRVNFNDIQNEALCQLGSEINVNKKVYSQEEVDIGELYQ